MFSPEHLNTNNDNIMTLFMSSMSNISLLYTILLFGTYTLFDVKIINRWGIGIIVGELGQSLGNCDNRWGIGIIVGVYWLASIAELDL